MRLSPLTEGSKVYVVATASPVEGELLSRGKSLLEERGFRVVEAEGIRARRGYLAGDDGERAEALNRVFRESEGGAVLFARGGYGTLRILPLIDYGLLKENPKVLAGFSDVSCLLAYLSSRHGIPTLHACMPATGQVGKEGCRIDLLADILTDRVSYPLQVGGKLEGAVSPRPIRGISLGGCLSVLVSLLGTPFEPDFEGKVLFLEEVGEKAYRVDRKMTQLRISGKLSRVAGVVLGEMIPVEGESTGHLQEIVADACQRAGVPLFLGLPVGHGERNEPIPMGVEVEVLPQRGGWVFSVKQSPFEVEW
ncbi:MAG: LD-carboxypeptidase [Deltaproteobacteria bacterium]|nr:MAG: LD-carboxypeptidase [Deltaproteobacteria bacterium]